MKGNSGTSALDSKRSRDRSSEKQLTTRLETTNEMLKTLVQAKRQLRCRSGGDSSVGAGLLQVGVRRHGCRQRDGCRAAGAVGYERQRSPAGAEVVAARLDVGPAGVHQDPQVRVGVPLGGAAAARGTGRAGAGAAGRWRRRQAAHEVAVRGAVQRKCMRPAWCTVTSRRLPSDERSLVLVVFGVRTEAAARSAGHASVHGAGGVRQPGVRLRGRHLLRRRDAAALHVADRRPP